MSTLSELRLRHELSQRDLAELLGVTPGAIGNWESGQRIPRLEHIRKMADLFGVKMDDIEFPALAEQAAAQEESA